MDRFTALIIWSVPGLLLHLCIFHAYITLHDMTTYEYVRAQRQAADQAHREAALAQAPATTSTTGQAEEEEGAGSRCECSLGAGRGNRVAPAHTNNKKVSIQRRLSLLTIISISSQLDA